MAAESPTSETSPVDKGEAEYEAFQDWLREEGSSGASTDIGKGRLRKIAAGTQDPVQVDTLSIDVDEPLAVGERDIKPQRAYDRAVDPHNRQLLESLTNQRTKHTRISPEDVARQRIAKEPVTIDPNAQAGPGQPEIADPSALLERRFDEVVELKEVFDDAFKTVENNRSLKPTQIKADINRKIREIIKEGSTDAGRKVRDALDALGFEFTDKGLVAKKL